MIRLAIDWVGEYGVRWLVVTGCIGFAIRVGYRPVKPNPLDALGRCHDRVTHEIEATRG